MMETEMIVRTDMEENPVSRVEARCHWCQRRSVVFVPSAEIVDGLYPPLLELECPHCDRYNIVVLNDEKQDDDDR
jgi:hypothetical protein